MSILFRTKECLTIGQLVPAWAGEIPEAKSNPQQFEHDLVQLLLEDIVNERLDGAARRGREAWATVYQTRRPSLLPRRPRGSGSPPFQRHGALFLGSDRGDEGGRARFCPKT